MFIRIIMAFAYILLSSMTTAVAENSSEKAIEIPIIISELPKDAWEKSRIFSSFESDTLVLTDLGRGPFNDTSMWEIPIDQALPEGRKVLSFDLIVGEKHKPLWGDKLFQPIINGVEAEPALNAVGISTFKKSISEDSGRGFVPVKSQTITLQMDSSDLSLSTFSLMTAGAENFEIKISNMKVVVWPSSGKQDQTQRLHVSTLGYREDGSKIAYMEWGGDDERPSKENVTVSLINKTNGRTEEINSDLQTQGVAISGSRVSPIDLSGLTEGQYDLTAPSSEKNDIETNVSFEVKSGNEQIKILRNKAWSSFYWITNGPFGPYPKAHQQDLGAVDFDVPTETKDVSGGWFDAGDYGKYTVNGAYSVSLMLITGLIAPETLPHNIDKVANAPADVASWLRVADSELSFLYKMQRADGAVYHKATSRKWPSLSATPEDDRGLKWLMPVTTTATANFASAMSLAAKLYFAQDDEAYKKRGAEFQIAAEKALNWLDANSDIEMIELVYEGDEYGGPYHDDDDSDERFFAHASYAALTGNRAALTIVLADLKEIKGKMEAREYDVNWRTVDLLGVWALAASDNLDNRAKKAVMGILRNASNNWRDIQTQSSWGIPIADDDNLYWGSNGVLATIGWHWVLWSHISGDNAFVQSAETQLHYLFGLNPLDKTYVTGAYPNSVKAPHFRPSASGRIELPAGFIAGGPNGINSDVPPMRSYVDDIESFTTNEFAINWQSPWALYTSLLAAKTQ